MSNIKETARRKFFSPLPKTLNSLTDEECKFHIELYKFCLEFTFKAITIFFTVVGGVFALALRSGQQLSELSSPVRRILLVTPFLICLAMILGFGVSTIMWLSLWGQVNGKMQWRKLLWSLWKGNGNDAKSELHLAIGIYSPSLTLILVITTLIFSVFLILLRDLMASYDVWFCPECWLG